MRRSGRIQRRGALLAATADGVFTIDSVHARALLESWAWGRHGRVVSATVVQRDASLAYQDMARVLGNVNVSLEHIPSSLAALATLGDSGRYPANCARDLRSLLGEPNVAKCTFVPIHMKVLKSRSEPSRVTLAKTSSLCGALSCYRTIQSRICILITG